MCKNAGLLIGYDFASHRALVTRADCEQWSCPECRILLRDRWVMRAQIGAKKYIAEGQTLDFVTITGHEKLTNFAQTYRVWRKAWPKLYNALKRRNVALQYMIIPEAHEDGRMHIHALWTANVTKRWLKDNARERGLGFMQDVSHVKSAIAAVRYVTKYIGKDLGADMPKGFHRVRVSAGWPAIPKPVTNLSGLKWEYIGGNGALEVVYRECYRKQLDLIDLETGEMFDDIDLGTVTAEF